MKTKPTKTERAIRELYHTISELAGIAVALPIATQALKDNDNLIKYERRQHEN